LLEHLTLRFVSDAVQLKHTEMPRKIIIDTDMGVDDALTLIFAAKLPEVQIDAVTTVSGNVHVDQATENALKILDVLGEKNVLVGRGAAKPLARSHVHSQEIHGRNGLGDSDLPEPQLRTVYDDGVGLLIQRVLATRKGEVTLVTIGPLTNVAQAFTREPRLADRLDRIVIMGGAYGLTRYGRGGNVTSEAEYNIYEDPEAAEIVFHSNARITAVGLDVTMNPSAALTRQHIDHLASKGTKVGEVIRKITANMMSRWGLVYLHDPIAIAAAVNKTLLRTEKRIGRTTIIRRDESSSALGHEIDIAVNIDAKHFIDMFLEAVASS